jgi:hypothetical protein
MENKAIFSIAAGGTDVTARGVNLTFVSPMLQSRRANVKFKNATRTLSLRVVLAIPTFGRGHGAMGAKCRNRTTRKPKTVHSINASDRAWASKDAAVLRFAG